MTAWKHKGSKMNPPSSHNLLISRNMFQQRILKMSNKKYL